MLSYGYCHLWRSSLIQVNMVGSSESYCNRNLAWAEGSQELESELSAGHPVTDRSNLRTNYNEAIVTISLRFWFNGGLNEEITKLRRPKSNLCKLQGAEKNISNKWAKILICGVLRFFFFPTWRPTKRRSCWTYYYYFYDLKACH